MRDAVIVSTARTPIGKAYRGAFNDTQAQTLGGHAIAHAVDRAGIDPAEVEDVVMGAALQQGSTHMNVARQALIRAGLPTSVPGMSLDRQCSSGLMSIGVIANRVRLGEIDIGVGGGLESVSLVQTPAMNVDRLVDPWIEAHRPDVYMTMLETAEIVADRYGVSREAQDEYAVGSLSKALSAQDSGAFAHEITPVTVPTRGGDLVVDADEQPGTAWPEKIPHLKPAFRDGGTVTAANASSISDGAAALVLADVDHAQAAGLNIRARIVGHSSHAQAPEWFSTAPIPAVQKLLARIGWDASDVDLWEVNEAFAVVPMVFMHEFGLSRDSVNVNGGACALGHPIGASGARILVTLIHEMKRQNKNKGCATLCIGGGMGIALCIEKI